MKRTLPPIDLPAKREKQDISLPCGCSIEPEAYEERLLRGISDGQMAPSDAFLMVSSGRLSNLPVDKTVRSKMEIIRLLKLNRVDELRRVISPDLYPLDTYMTLALLEGLEDVTEYFHSLPDEAFINKSRIADKRFMLDTFCSLESPCMIKVLLCHAERIPGCEDCPTILDEAIRRALLSRDENYLLLILKLAKEWKHAVAQPYIIKCCMERPRVLAEIVTLLNFDLILQKLLMMHDLTTVTKLLDIYPRYLGIAGRIIPPFEDIAFQYVDITSEGYSRRATIIVGAMIQSYDSSIKMLGKYILGISGSEKAYDRILGTMRGSISAYIYLVLLSAVKNPDARQRVISVSRTFDNFSRAAKVVEAAEKIYA